LARIILSSRCCAAAGLAIALLSAGSLFADERVYIALCNRCGLPDSVIRRASAEIELLFESCGVKIAWRECEGDLEDLRVSGSDWFLIRVLSRRSCAGGHCIASVDAVGRAFVGPDGTGHLADAYFPAVQDLSDWQQGDSAVLLGDVVAHELGHLILGPGHTPAGIMRAVWKAGEFDALRKGWLQFTDDERQRIRVALRRTSPGNVAANTEAAGTAGYP
jgi:hypothetical protein